MDPGSEPADGESRGVVAVGTQPERDGSRRIRRTFLLAFMSVVALLGIGAATELYYGHRENVDAAVRLQQETAKSAAIRIRGFVEDIEKSLRAASLDRKSIERGRLGASSHFELLKLLKTTPAIIEAAALDMRGREIARVSRERLVLEDQLGDQSSSIGFARARNGERYIGRVFFVRDSEPFMRVAVPIEWFVGQIEGVMVADVSLKFVRDVISSISITGDGYVYVVSSDGDLIAHPDITLVLQRMPAADLPQVRAAIEGKPISFKAERSLTGEEVYAAHATIEDLGWSVIVEQPAAEVFAPLLASILRTAAYSVVAIVLALLISLLVARKVLRPLAVLSDGARRLGAGDLDHRIDMRTGDEFGEVAAEFNGMAARLGDLYTSLEQRVSDRTADLNNVVEELQALNARVKLQATELANWNATLETRVAEQVNAAENAAELRRFVSPQLADAILERDAAGVLESHRREITAVFCDLRGFTTFSHTVEPEDVMRLLGDYHEALGALIRKYEGTLERFLGDGLLVIFNDPVPCPNPVERAVRMAVEMRTQVRDVIEGWQKGGFELGFGVGIAEGYATLGRIGFEGRYDYASVGNVSNLASRLCDEAQPDEVLIPQRLIAKVDSFAELAPVGTRDLKGFPQAVAIYNVIGIADERSDDINGR